MEWGDKVEPQFQGLKVLLVVPLLVIFLGGGVPGDLLWICLLYCGDLVLSDDCVV